MDNLGFLPTIDTHREEEQVLNAVLSELTYRNVSSSNKDKRMDIQSLINMEENHERREIMKKLTTGLEIDYASDEFSVFLDKKLKKVIVACRGSDFSLFKDNCNVLNIALTGESLPNRLFELAEVTARYRNTYQHSGFKFNSTGHSAGGTCCNSGCYFMKNMGSIVFNPGYSIKPLRVRADEETAQIRTKTDLVSVMGQLYSMGNPNFINLDSDKRFNAHSNVQFMPDVRWSGERLTNIVNNYIDMVENGHVYKRVPIRTRVKGRLNSKNETFPIDSVSYNDLEYNAESQYNYIDNNETKDELTADDIINHDLANDMFDLIKYGINTFIPEEHKVIRAGGKVLSSFFSSQAKGNSAGETVTDAVLEFVGEVIPENVKKLIRMRDDYIRTIQSVANLRHYSVLNSSVRTMIDHANMINSVMTITNVFVQFIDIPQGVKTAFSILGQLASLWVLLASGAAAVPILLAILGLLQSLMQLFESCGDDGSNGGNESEEGGDCEQSAENDNNPDQPSNGNAEKECQQFDKNYPLGPEEEENFEEYDFGRDDAHSVGSVDSYSFPDEENDEHTIEEEMFGDDEELMEDLQDIERVFPYMVDHQFPEYNQSTIEDEQVGNDPIVSNRQAIVNHCVSNYSNDKFHSFLEKSIRKVEEELDHLKSTREKLETKKNPLISKYKKIMDSMVDKCSYWADRVVRNQHEIMLDFQQDSSEFEYLDKNHDEIQGMTETDPTGREIIQNQTILKPNFHKEMNEEEFEFKFAQVQTKHGNETFKLDPSMGNTVVPDVSNNSIHSHPKLKVERTRQAQSGLSSLVLGKGAKKMNIHYEKAPIELSSVYQGSNMSNLLSGELSLFSTPETELIFEKKFIDSQLWCYDNEGGYASECNDDLGSLAVIDQYHSYPLFKNCNVQHDKNGEIEYFVNGTYQITSPDIIPIENSKEQVYEISCLLRSDIRMKVKIGLVCFDKNKQLIPWFSTHQKGNSVTFQSISGNSITVRERIENWFSFDSTNPNNEGNANDKRCLGIYFNNSEMSPNTIPDQVFSNSGVGHETGNAQEGAIESANGTTIRISQQCLENLQPFLPQLKSGVSKLVNTYVHRRDEPYLICKCIDKLEPPIDGQSFQSVSCRVGNYLSNENVKFWPGTHFVSFVIFTNWMSEGEELELSRPRLTWKKVKWNKTN